MSTFRLIIFGLVTLSLLNSLIQADLLENIEKHLAKKDGDYLSEALSYVNLKYNGFRMGGISKKEVLRGLKSIEEMDELIECWPQYTILEFSRKLNKNGKLYQVAKEALEKQYKSCYNDFKEELEEDREIIEQVSQIIVTFVNGVDGLCSKQVDRTKPLWELDCMQTVKTISSEKSTGVFFELMKNFEIENLFEVNTKTTKTKSFVLNYLENLFANIYHGHCMVLRHESANMMDTHRIDSLSSIKEITGKVFEPEVELLLKKAVSGLHFCNIYSESLKKKVAARILAQIYV